MNILGIESSFDETGAAIIENGNTILTNVVATSAQMHQKYGGVVPEVAARKQIESMIPVLTEAMNGYTKDDIDAIAVTVGPGLIGSLLVGVETAKTLAFAWNKPIIPVNHVLAHIYGVFLEVPNNETMKQFNNKEIYFPAIALVVSGAHTELYLMESAQKLKWLGGTLDDAAGECFDKCARLLGLPYPGGPEIAAMAAKTQNSELKSQLKLPRPMIDDKTLNFSFSGLKTAVIREWTKYQQLTTDNSPARNTSASAAGGQLITSFAYEIQEAITDVLVAKTLRATHEYKARSIIVSGGVAANKRLSQKFISQLTTHNSQLTLHIPPPHLCVDSAAYIAAYGFYQNKTVPWEKIIAQPDLSVEV